MIFFGSKPEQPTEQTRVAPEVPRVEEKELPAELKNAERSLFERLRGKGTVAAAAFSAFLCVSNAFAEQKELDLTDSASITLSLGGTTEKTPDFNPEMVKYYNAAVLDSDFYKGLTMPETKDSADKLILMINGSATASEFFNNLREQNDDLNDLQKTLFLQRLGALLAKTYNYDMLANDNHVKVSDEAMFLGLKLNTPTGLCGNIHTFMVRAAEELGVEAWLQSGNWRDSRHVWMGMTAGSGDDKQIVFINYGDIIPTGTLNYRDALGIAERYTGNIIDMFEVVSDKDQVLFPVKSRAFDIVERASNMEDTADRLQRELSQAEKPEKSNFEIKINPDTQEIKLDNDTLGFAIFNFQDTYGNPYQSLKDLKALRGSMHIPFPGESLNFDADVTIMHMNIKDMDDGTAARDLVIGRLAADYIKSHNLTKTEYGDLLLNWGTTLQEAIIKQTNDLEMLPEGTAGARMIYVSPTDKNKFYIGAAMDARMQESNIQVQGVVLHEVAKTFNIGAAIKVNEATVVNLEASESKTEWGDRSKIVGGLKSDSWSAEARYEKDLSKQERFIPSAEKIGVEAGYRGPKYKVDILGFQNMEKYKDDRPKSALGAEVKLTIFLW